MRQSRGHGGAAPRCSPRQPRKGSPGGCRDVRSSGSSCRGAAGALLPRPLRFAALHLPQVVPGCGFVAVAAFQHQRLKILSFHLHSSRVEGCGGAGDEELLAASLAELPSTAAPALGCREERCSLGSSCMHVAALVFSSFIQTIRAKKTLGPSAIWLGTRPPELVFFTKPVQSSLQRTSSSALR